MSNLLVKNERVIQVEEPSTTLAPVHPLHAAFQDVPGVLKAEDRWVNYDKDKRPVNSMTGGLASSQDSTTWSTFEQALKSLKNGRARGVGFVFTAGDNILGVDIDGCVVDGKVLPWGQEIVDSLGSYTEISPSKTGLHIICHGTNFNKGHKVKYQGGAVEIYTTARYFTVSGDHLPGTPTEVNDATVAIKSLMLTLGIKDKPAPQISAVKAGSNIPEALLEFLLSEPDFIQNWECKRREPNFFKPDGSPDPSTYDMALANYGVQGGLDDETIAAIIHAFRVKHGFNPEKALRQDYIGRTIAKAKEGLNSGCTPAASIPQAGRENHAAAPNSLEDALENNEVGDAELYIMLNRGVRLYDRATGEWFVWGGHGWVEDNTGEAQAAVQGVVDLYKAEHDRLMKLARDANDDSAAGAIYKQVKAFGQRIRQLQTAKRRENVLRLARDGKHSLGISGQEWDSDPSLIGCPNGVLELNSQKRAVVFRPGKPEDYIKTAVPTRWPGAFGEYSSDDLRRLAVTKIFSRFLSGIFDGHEDLIAYVQRLLGYALSGTASEDVFPILWGKGRNGKTTLLEYLSNILGPVAGPVKAELLLQQDRVQSSAGANADLMTLRGKRIVWASETEEHRKLSEGRVKLLTGGDTIIARPPYGKREVSWNPTHTMLLLTNKRPRADAEDYALWQRLALIPFTLSFVDQPEGASERQRIPDLMDQMLPEKSAVLAWLLAGWCDYLDRGLNPPDEVKRATAQYRSAEDGLGRFIEERCLVRPDVQVRAGSFKEAYEEWCKGEGLRPMWANKLGKLIRARYDSIKKDGVVYYIGIGLLADTTGQGG